MLTRFQRTGANLRDRLHAGDTLAVNDQLRSPDGRYELVYQPDGNLVLYNASMNAFGASNTFGKPAGHAIMQSDGNFAIYGPDGAFEWNTGTTVAGSQLVLQNDANLVIYDASGGAVWATNTQR